MAQESRKSQLIAELARARHGVSANVHGLRRDVVHRLGAAYRRHSIAWISGAGLLGFVLARFPARTKKAALSPRGRKPGAEGKVVKAGLLITVLKIAFDLTRPVLTKWLTRRVVSYAADRFGPRRHD